MIPTFRYHDAAAAIEWLCTALGFERHMVIEDDAGTVIHAQLTLAGGMIMLGQARDDHFGRLQRPLAIPDEPVTSSPYIVIDDVDAHCEQARAAGARIVSEPADQEHGGRLYTCRDPEGQVWNFGTYDPWAG